MADERTELKRSELNLESFLGVAILSYELGIAEQTNVIETEAAGIDQAELEIDVLKAKARQHQDTISSARVKLKEEEEKLLQEYKTQKHAYFSTITAVFSEIDKLQTSQQEFETKKEEFQRALVNVSGGFTALEQQNNKNRESLDVLIDEHQLKTKPVVFDFNPAETTDGFGLSLTLPNPTSETLLLKRLRYAVDESYKIISERYTFHRVLEQKYATITYSFSLPSTAPITLPQANYIRAELMKVIQERMHPAIKESGIQFAFTASQYDKLIGIDIETTAEFANDSIESVESVEQLQVEQLQVEQLQVELDAELPVAAAASIYVSAVLETDLDSTVAVLLASKVTSEAAVDISVSDLSQPALRSLETKVESEVGVEAEVQAWVEAERITEQILPQKDIQTRRLEYIRSVYFKIFKDDDRPSTADLKQIIKYNIDKQMCIANDAVYYNNRILLARTTLSGALRGFAQQSSDKSWSYSLEASVNFIDGYARKQAVDYRKEDPISAALALEDLTKASPLTLEIDLATVNAASPIDIPTALVSESTSPIVIDQESLETKVEAKVQAERITEQILPQKNIQTRRLEYIRSNYFSNFDETITDVLIGDIKNVLKNIDTDIGIETRADTYYHQNQVNNERNSKANHILKFEREEGTFYYEINSVVKFVDKYVEKQLSYNLTLKDPIAEALKQEYSTAIPLVETAALVPTAAVISTVDDIQDDTPTATVIPTAAFTSAAESLDSTVSSSSSSSSAQSPESFAASLIDPAAEIIINLYQTRRLAYVEKLFFSEVTAEIVTKKQLIELLKDADRECFFEEDEDSVYLRLIKDDVTIADESILKNRLDNFTKQQAIAFINYHIEQDGEHFSDYKDIVQHHLVKEDAEKRGEKINYFTGLDEIVDIDLLFAMRGIDIDLFDNNFNAARTKKQYTEELEKLVKLRLTTKPDKPNSYQPEKNNETPAVYEVKGAIDVVNTYYKTRRILKDNYNKDHALGRSALMTELAKALNIEASGAREIARKDEKEFKFDEGAEGSAGSPISAACNYSTVKVLQYAAYRTDRLS